MTLQVIGAGLPRTGSVSLKRALEQLGYGPCHHMGELHLQPVLRLLWERALSGTLGDWEEIFGAYTSTTDAPGCLFYRELAARYPQAKVILALRDQKSWCDSVQSTIFARTRQSDVGAGPMGPILTKIGAFGMKRYGLSAPLPLLTREELITWFNAHNEEVQATIAKDRLLIYRLGEGWQPICGFLGAAVPDVPFPLANERAGFDAMLKQRMLQPPQ